MKFSVQTPDQVVSQERAEFERWDKRLDARHPLIIERNKFISENQVQWGKKAGLNTGNGISESEMGLDLFLALSSEEGPYKDDPDWWKDDKKFYAFLRKHPELDRRPGKHRS